MGHDEVVPTFLWLLAQDDLIAHNAAFDLGVVVQASPTTMPAVWEAVDNDRIVCTMAVEKLWRIARDEVIGGCGLAECVAKHLGGDVEGKRGGDSWRLRYQELEDTPVEQWPEAARDYAYGDAEWVHELWETTYRTWPSPDTFRQVRADWALHLCGAHGIRTDAPSVLKLEAELHEHVNHVRVELQRRGFVKSDGVKDQKKMQAAVEAAYSATGREVPRTAKGAIQVTAEVLTASGDPDLMLLADIAGDGKLLNTYVPLLKLGFDRPISPRWNVLVKTGRTSCSAPNLQNQPNRPGVRECFIPRPGYVFCSLDYALAELCALSQILLGKFEASKMAEALQTGQELHLRTAASLLGISYEEAVARYEAGDPAVKEGRKMAKVANFGIPGGMGAAALASTAPGYGVTMTETEANHVRVVWLSAYPEMKRYFAGIARLAEKGRFTLTQRGSERVRGGCGYTDGCNSPFQGLAADFAKQGLVDIQRECWNKPKSPLWGSRVVAFIHDEFFLEMPEARAHEAAQRAAELAVAAGRAWCPDIPIKAEPALMRRWTKKAEPVFRGGRLIPWEDRPQGRRSG